MKVNVRLFAAPRELLGSSEITEELPEGTTLQDLVDRLHQRHSELETFHLTFAVNTVYAPLEEKLHDGDEVACIPPVGGG